METIGVMDSPEAIRDAVRRLGFLPFFKNEIPGFSIAEHTPLELWFSDAQDGPWEWKGPVARTGECVYGKFLTAARASSAVSSSRFSQTTGETATILTRCMTTASRPAATNRFSTRSPRTEAF